MDKRQTVESLKAQQIAAEIRDLPHPFLKTYTVFEANAQTVARNLRKLVLTDEIIVTVKKDTLYVGTKQHRKTSELVKLIRKLAMHVDDPRLYDEAMELVRTI